jgi:hypothetical protein
MYLLENVGRDVKKKQEEKDLIVCELSSALTNPPSTKNKKSSN